MMDLRDIEERLERARERAKANRWQDVLLSLAHAGPEIEQFPEALDLLSEAQARQGQHRESRDSAQRALALYRASGDRTGMWRMQNNLGSAAFYLGDFATAEAEWNGALQLLTDLQEPDKSCMIWNNLGLVNTVLERFDESIRCYDQALEISRGCGNLRIQTTAMQNLGILYRDRKEWDRAEQCFVETARLAQAADYPLALALAITERAHIIRMKGNRAQAEQMARMAMLRFDTLSHSAGLAEVYRLLGALTRERGAWQESEEYLKKADTQNSLVDNPLMAAEIQQELGLMLRDSGRLEEAAQVLTAAADSFEALGRKGQADETRALLLVPVPAD